LYIYYFKINIIFYNVLLDTYNEAEKETFLCVPNSDQTNFGRGKRKKLSNIRQIDFFGDDSDDGMIYCFLNIYECYNKKKNF
jgi:hypothetical protein